ncbi:MAG: diacylglycerol kinase family lipid kinase [Anaerolineales bacterium]|nr:MAG: diacylglycerol kinase family lipid kinase [Anaerolineales bacterium]
MRRAILAYNPTAGRFPSRLLAERAGRVLEENNWKVQLEQTQSGEHIVQLARQAAEAGLEAFFMAGGDGSLNQAVKGLIGSETALGVLPSGTANVWAQELGLPGLTWTRWLALEESARRLATGKICPVDVGYCNGRPFLLWAGIGLDAFVVHRIEPRKRWEKHFAVVQYATSLVWRASYWHGMNLKVEADGKQISGHFLLAVVSNVHLYAGGMANLSPQARLDDGTMDLWLFEGETLGDTVQLAWDLWAGRHVESERVQCVPFRHLRLESDSSTHVQLDGEGFNGDGEVEIEVEPLALNVLVPEKTPQPLFVGEG